MLCTVAAIVAASVYASSQTADFGPTFVGLPLSQFRGMTRVDQAFNLMQSAGANFTEIRTTWAQLEPSPGKVNFAVQPFPLFESVRKTYPALFGSVAVNIEVVVTANRSMPEDLALRNFSDPVVLDRFTQLLGKLAEYNRKFPINYVIIGHEADVYLSLHPTEVGAFEDFYAHAVETVHRLMPGVEVGTSMTHTLVTQNPTLVDRIAQYSDLLVYTYYPVDASWQMRPLTEVPDDMQSLAAHAQGKSFGLLEVGYSVHGLNGGSEQNQAQFVQTLFQSLEPYRSSGQLRFLQYWMLFDFPPEQAFQVAQAQGHADPAVVAFLSSLGLRRYDAGGAKRAGWDVFSSMATTWTARPLPLQRP